jgi:alpha-tubulin suppressor-like RCC1 family protein
LRDRSVTKCRHSRVSSDYIPVLAIDLDVDLLDVAAGPPGASSYALSSDGSLWVWGFNHRGQLGLGDFVDRLTPTQLLPPTGYKFESIAASGNHALAHSRAGAAGAAALDVELVHMVKLHQAFIMRTTSDH